MLHTAAGLKIDSEMKTVIFGSIFGNIGSGLSINSIWDCLFFWTNSLLSDLCEGPHSISFYKYIDENGWLVTYSTYFLYDDKSCSIINFYSRKLKVYFSKDSRATGNDLSKESIFFATKRLYVSWQESLVKRHFYDPAPIIYFPRLWFPLGCIKITSFPCA